MTGNDHLRGRKVDATGRSTGKLSSSRFREYISPPKDGVLWGWVTLEMMDSAAWCAASNAAIRTLMRILAEHVRHRGFKNGELIVTYRDFTKAGLNGDRVRPAVIELEALGFIRCVSKGRQAWGDDKGAPRIFRLTHLGDSQGSPPTHEWRRFETVADAKKAAARAVKADKAAAAKQDAAKKKRAAARAVAAAAPALKEAVNG
jgi:hypothetical protein